jgi:hypothetical protein
LAGGDGLANKDLFNTKNKGQIIHLILAEVDYHSEIFLVG